MATLNDPQPVQSAVSVRLGSSSWKIDTNLEQYPWGYACCPMYIVRTYDILIEMLRLSHVIHSTTGSGSLVERTWNSWLKTLWWLDLGAGLFESNISRFKSSRFRKTRQIQSRWRSLIVVLWRRRLRWRLATSLPMLLGVHRSSRHPFYNSLLMAWSIL